MLKDKVRTAKYPWIKDPNQLPNNRQARLTKVPRMLKRIIQIVDVLGRGVAGNLMLRL